jgi:hypothetical protein
MDLWGVLSIVSYPCSAEVSIFFREKRNIRFSFLMLFDKKRLKEEKSFEIVEIILGEIT